MRVKGFTSFYIHVKALFIIKNYLSLNKENYAQRSTLLYISIECTKPTSNIISYLVSNRSPPTDATLYQQKLKLYKISLTCPNVSFAVNKLFQFMHYISNKYWTAVM